MGTFPHLNAIASGLNVTHTVCALSVRPPFERLDSQVPWRDFLSNDPAPIIVPGTAMCRALYVGVRSFNQSLI